MAVEMSPGLQPGTPRAIEKLRSLASRTGLTMRDGPLAVSSLA
jgi:hypothetical protein